jgi:hypothetical protein
MVDRCLTLLLFFYEGYGQMDGASGWAFARLWDLSCATCGFCGELRWFGAPVCGCLVYRKYTHTHFTLSRFVGEFGEL